MLKKHLYTMALVSTIALTAAANAKTMTTSKTMTTETHTTTKTIAHGNQIAFGSLDYNKDGVYSMNEVGNHMFRSFDLDGNELIDNIEWDKKSVLTQVPVEKATYTYVDLDGDGHAEENSYTYETFSKQTGLALFDENKDGLTAGEFIDKSFYDLDFNDDHMIDAKEWQSAYVENIKEKAEHMKSSSYN